LAHHPPARRRLLSEERLCEIAGVNRSTRRNWAERGLLHIRTSGCQSIDAVELVVLDRLTDVLGGTDAPIAWLQVRADVGAAEHDELDLIFDTQHKEAQLLSAGAPLELARLRHGRPIRVVPMTEAIRDIKAAFDRVTAEA
jgi:hypothetical protein